MVYECSLLGLPLKDDHVITIIIRSYSLVCCGMLRGGYPKGHTEPLLGAPSHFPLEEILRAILMAWT